MAIKKNIKFDLPIGGIRAKNMQEIREHFTLEILEYARNGTLVKWLRSRKLEDELTAVQALSELDDDALFLGLCTVFSVSPRQNLLTALAQLRGEFNAAKVDIKPREKTLERALSELARSVSIASNNSGLKEDNFLTQAVINTNIKIAASLAKWREDVSRQQRNTEFREQFGDSLLVYVYGKVKAGKSAIGNYVAYGHGDPNRSIIDAAEPTPEFFCEAIAEDAKKPEAELTAAELEEKRKLDAQRNLAEQRKFAVGACETTSFIQGFKLSGLTWIDSPGLHSRTEPKGQLAQDYVDAADLILYPISSNQPGRATDLEEIADLLQKGKRVEVVITRCDVTEVDKNDAGELIYQLVMKSDSDRAMMSKYTYDQIVQLEKKQCNDQLEVLTVSVRYAEEHDNNADELEKSGMNALFRKLTALTQSESVRLKKETPLNNLRAVVNHILTGDLSVKELRDDLTLLETAIEKSKLLRKIIAFEQIRSYAVANKPYNGADK
ncbi:hypothetical protein CKO12_09580 [Chromatium okenii]|uniref:dynamin family protein n=1 Tax=Chromatium okenii TaxID=61644 RepID=UPI0019070AF6|nr:dynamin family protein [Chromatium okenii]MBK1642122.1 hypothetical protein [Chromatium okenii]